MESEGVEIPADVNHTELENREKGPESAQGGGNKAQKKRKQRELPTLSIDRPTRERKSIERLILSPDKEVKEFKIPKGSGTRLKDIPNIVFKLSKRRGGDEVVQVLHKVLFGKTAKHAAKANILQFSGFVWGENEEKEKTKIKDRLEKVVKETLFQISDVLDLRLHRVLKKEDAVLKVFEFLESPYKTTDKLLEESAKLKKTKKAKKTPAKGTKKGRTPAKSPKGKKKTPKKKQTSDEEDDELDLAISEDVVEEVDEEPEVEQEPEVEEEQEDKSDDDYRKKLVHKTKRKRKSKKEQLEQESEEDEEEASPKRRKVAQKERRKPAEKAKKEKKQRSKAEKVKEPSDEDLKAAISELLLNADFSKVTFIDVMKQLGEKFKVDLTHKKSHLKALIQEEIARLVGEGEDEDENSNTEPGDNEEKMSGDEQKDHEERKDHEDISKDGKNDEEGEDDDNVENSDGEDEDGKGEVAVDEERDEEMDSVEKKTDGGREDEDVQAEEDNAEAEGASTDTA